MSNIDKTIKDMRPRLRDIAPQTFWVSLIFGIFNIVVGYSIYNIIVLIHLRLIGIISIRLWAIIFLVHGVLMLASLVSNNWRFTRLLHFVGTLIKTAWWFELLAATTATGSTPFLLYVWSVLLSIQLVFWINFTPRIERVK